VAAVERFESASMALLPGQRVRVKVSSRHPWGVLVTIVGHEDVGASIDIIEQFGAQAPDDAMLEPFYPAVGDEIEAVVQQVRRYSAPAWARLSIRPEDLELFQWPCDFCSERTVLSPGGDGLVLDVRSTDGPGATTVIAHRVCLADRIAHGNTGERARTLRVGRDG
jgi:hypothetical protein